MTIDFEPMVTAIQTAVSAGIADVLPFAGALLAVFVAYKVIRRFVK